MRGNVGETTRAISGATPRHATSNQRRHAIALPRGCRNRSPRRCTHSARNTSGTIGEQRRDQCKSAHPAACLAHVPTATGTPMRRLRHTSLRATLGPRRTPSSAPSSPAPAARDGTGTHASRIGLSMRARCPSVQGGPDEDPRDRPADLNGNASTSPPPQTRLRPRSQRRRGPLGTSARISSWPTLPQSAQLSRARFYASRRVVNHGRTGSSTGHLQTISRAPPPKSSPSRVCSRKSATGGCAQPHGPRQPRANSARDPRCCMAWAKQMQNWQQAQDPRDEVVFLHLAQQPQSASLHPPVRAPKRPRAPDAALTRSMRGGRGPSASTAPHGGNRERRPDGIAQRASCAERRASRSLAPPTPGRLERPATRLPPRRPASPCSTLCSSCSTPLGGGGSGGE